MFILRADRYQLGVRVYVQAEHMLPPKSEQLGFNNRFTGTMQSQNSSVRSSSMLVVSPKVHHFYFCVVIHGENS